ncbi:MAG: ABC transporter permease [Chlamydiae bacterium]|nr:ABC transporter permease [Chlamydiota bacterium]MBI3265895.1 ABC transporter permease [Chlamydiota bacterium]
MNSTPELSLRNFLSDIGRSTIDGLYQLGGITILFLQTTSRLFSRLSWRVLFVKQCYQCGVLSLPVVLLTGAFTGMVLAVQSYYQFHQITMDTAIGILVGLSMTRELGPVLTAVMVAGRVGAAMAAELGTMRVTEQIDALRTLATDPVSYLIVPRFLACMVVVPILTTFAIFVGILGGYVVGVKMLHINHTFFIQNMVDYTKVSDLMSGLTKSVVFGVLVAIISCYKGFFAENGAEGVGIATTEAVVYSCISILVSDFFLSIVLF